MRPLFTLSIAAMFVGGCVSAPTRFSTRSAASRDAEEAPAGSRRGELASSPTPAESTAPEAEVHHAH